MSDGANNSDQVPVCYPSTALTKNNTKFVIQTSPPPMDEGADEGADEGEGEGEDEGEGEGADDSDQVPVCYVSTTVTEQLLISYTDKPSDGQQKCGQQNAYVDP